MIKKMVSHRLGCVLALILIGSVFTGAFAYGAADADFPLEIIIGGKTYKFATHGGSKASGNWIELSGGTNITLPYLSLQYNGVADADYTKTGNVQIDTDSSFIGDSVVYPFATHPVYAPGDTVSFTVRGPASLSGNSVHVRLLQVVDPQDWVDAASDLFNGDNTAFETRIHDFVQAPKTGNFDVNGDYSNSYVINTPGDYILLAIYEDGATTKIYSATPVEVLDGELAATVPVDEIDEGDDLDIDLALTGGATGTMVYGVLMIKESAYSAVAQMTSSGSIASTGVTVNGAEIIEGGSTSFSLFAGGLAGFDKDALTDFMSQAFDSDEYAIAFSSSTAATTSTVSMTTNDLDEDDYVILCGVWDYDDSIYAGDRLLGLTQDTIYVDNPVFMPPIGGGGVTTPNQDEFNEMNPVEQAETIASLTTEEAVDLLEDSSAEDAAQVLETIDTAQAVELIEAMDDETATEVLNTMQPEAAGTLLTESSVETATQLLTQAEATQAAQIVENLDTNRTRDIVTQAVTTGNTSSVATVLNNANKETVGDVLLAVEPETGAQVIREMANQDLTDAAERVETAVKRQINALDPDQKQEYRQKLKETIENPELSVDDLVNLFVEIANLPETPSTVAEIFEIIELSKTVEVVDGMVAQDKEEEVALVFSYLSVESLEEIYSALASATRTAIYPYFDAETLANLPQLGEFTVTSLTISEDTVEPGDAVSVTAVVENIGDDVDSTTVTISIDGVEYESELVTLNAGDSTTLTWSVSKTAEGTYSIEVMGETVSFTVKAPPTPAEFSLSNLQVSPSIVEPGMDITVSFSIENTGEESGSYSIDLKMDGATVETLSGTLDGGESESVSTTVSSTEEGTHTVAIDGLDAEFSVEQAPSGFPWIYAVVVIVIIAAAAYIYMQQKKQ